MKIISLQLTKGGRDRIKRIKLEAQKDYKGDDVSCLAVLKSEMTDSDAVFYRQIPFELTDEQCFFNDYRGFDTVMRRIKSMISTEDYDVW